MLRYSPHPSESSLAQSPLNIRTHLEPILDFKQFQLLSTQSNHDGLRSCHLQDKTPRTLIYGHTVENNIVHAYINQNGLLEVLIHDVRRLLIKHWRESDYLGIPPAAFVPSKRAYPEACDFELCLLLKKFGFELPFVQYQKNCGAYPEPGPFIGLCLEDMVQGYVAQDFEVGELAIDVSLLSDRAALHPESEKVQHQRAIKRYVRHFLRAYLMDSVLGNAAKKENADLWLQKIAPCVQAYIDQYLVNEGELCLMSEEQVAQLLEASRKAANEKLSELQSFKILA